MFLPVKAKDLHIEKKMVELARRFQDFSFWGVGGGEGRAVGFRLTMYQGKDKLFERKRRPMQNAARRPQKTPLTPRKV